MFTVAGTTLHTWFERDRQHVELRDAATDQTIIEWWDEEVTEAVEDGFLPRNAFWMGGVREDILHRAAVDEANARRCGLCSGVDAHAYGCAAGPSSAERRSLTLT